MIVVRAELWSAVNGSHTELARMHICNDGRASIANHRRGDYIGESFVGRDAATLAKGRVAKRGEIRDWPRLDFHIWNLVRRMLESMGYDKGPAPAFADEAARQARRVELARIIDPEAWAMADACPVGGGEPWTVVSLKKADQILALEARGS